MPLLVEVLTREEELESIREQWDALAVATDSPFCAPAWVMAWWRNVSPEGAAIRTVTIHAGEQLVAIAPFWVADGESSRAHYDAMAGRLGPSGPLLAPGREPELTAELARALAKMRPKLTQLRLEDRVGSAGLARPLARAWPGLRPWLHEAAAIPVPFVILDEGGYEGWLKAQSSSFRRETKRHLRRIEEAGGRFVLADPDGAERAVDAFLALHSARWSKRGGSTIMVPGIREMLLEATLELLPEERARIFLLEAEERPVAAQIVFAAGDEAGCWQGGFDEEWRRLSPLAQLIVHAIGDSAARGEPRVNLGSGGQEYKRRISNTEQGGAVIKLLPRGRSYPRARLQLASGKARGEVLPRAIGAIKRSLARQ